jgi:hypothetical protein
VAAGLELSPPQPARPAPIAHAISNRMAGRNPRIRLVLAKKGNMRIEQNHKAPAMAALSDRVAFADAAVFTVTIKALLCPAERFSGVGVTLQLAPLGAPEQVRLTVPANPGDPVSERL